MLAIALLSPRVMMILYHWMSGWCNSAIECKGPSLQTTIVYVGISGHQLNIVLLCKVNGLDWLSWNSHYCWTLLSLCFTFLADFSCLDVAWAVLGWSAVAVCLTCGLTLSQGRDLAHLYCSELLWDMIETDGQVLIPTHMICPNQGASLSAHFQRQDLRLVGLRACYKSWLLNIYSLVMWWGKIMVSCVGASAVQENSMFDAGKDNTQCLSQRCNITATKGTQVMSWER